jgi:MFS family permease
MNRTASAAAKAPRLGRSFAVLWLATGASTVGTAITDIALPLAAVLTFQASPFAVSALLAIEQIPWLVVGLVAGVWVDRWPRRTVLLLCDIGRAAVYVSIPVAAFLGILTLTQLFVVAAVAGSLTVFFSVAYTAVLPSLVPVESLTRANSRLSSTVTAADLSGRSAGGVLVQALSAPTAILIDVVSFLFSGILVRRLPKAGEHREGSAARDFRREVAEGLRYTIGDSVFRTITASNAVWNFWTAGQYALAFVFLVETLRVRPGWIGVLLAASGVGGTVGALTAGWLTRHFGSGRTWRAALIFAPVFGVLVPMAVSGWGVLLFAIGSAGLAGGVAITNVIGGSARQALCPPALMGRMSATSRVITWGAIPLGALVCGAIASAVGTRAALWVIAVGFFLSPVIVRASPLWRASDLQTVSVGLPKAALAGD